MYQQDSNRIWKAITGFSLLIIIMMGSIGIIWSLQTITNLEKKLETARTAIQTSNRNLRQSSQARLKLEQKIQILQQKLAIIETSQDQKVAEQRTPLPEYQEEETSPVTTYRSYGSTSSFTIFRGKCTSCPNQSY